MERPQLNAWRRWRAGQTDTPWDTGGDARGTP